jgi:plastocyanin
MFRARRSATVALLGAALLLFGACGDNTDVDSNDDAAAAGGGGISLTVVAQDFSFDQSTIELEAGATVNVTFENQGEAPHTFTSDDIDGLNVMADPGATASGTFTAPDEDGTYEFHCHIHPDQMQGEIVVGDGGGSTDSTEDTGEGDDENDDGSSPDAGDMGGY